MAICTAEVKTALRWKRAPVLVPGRAERPPFAEPLTSNLRLLLAWSLVASLGLSLPGSGEAAARQVPQAESAERGDQAQDVTAIESEETRRQGYLVQIGLPINGQVQEQVENTLRRLAEQTSPVADAVQRPVVVLEFDTSNGQTGRGSRLGSCLDLSRFLVSSEMSGLELVAFIPGPRGNFDSRVSEGASPKSELTGHAVLVALACNHLVMHSDSAIGRAGIDEPAIDDGLRNTYRQMSAKRRTLPPEVALSMLDSTQTLFRVDLGDGKNLYVDRAELQRLEGEGKVVRATTMSDGGPLPLYDSKTMAEFQLLRQRVDSRGEIAQRFRLHPGSLEGDPTLGAKWKSVQLSLSGDVDDRQVTWMINALNQLDPAVNLFIIKIDSDSGNPNQAIRLAQRLAEYDSTKTRTVAYVPEMAKGPAALIALACDHVVMGPDAVLGGVPRAESPERDEVMVEPVRELADRVERDWSLLLALVDRDQPLGVWSQRGTGQLRLMSAVQQGELPPEEQANWVLLRELQSADGLKGREAESLFVARYLVDDFGQLKALYQLHEEPVSLTPTIADRWVHGLARFLTAPWVTAWLLFGAMFFLMTEMSTPGIGLPGFLGSVCLLLFFWSQSCNGNVQWLEVILFIAGIAFILLDLFVLPGTGIFAVGGVAMVLASIVLAMQTFILPRTPEEMAQFPVSMAMIFAAMAGVISSLFLFRKYLAHMPYFNRLMLKAPAADELHAIDQRESLVNWQHLLGRRGQTVTPLVPAGKARFGSEVVDVISEGALIETNRTIVVIEVVGNRVVVRPLDF